MEIFVDPLGKPLPFSEVTGSKGKADKEKVGDYVFAKAQGRYNGEPLTGTGKIRRYAGAAWRRDAVSGTG
ncbi:hypothetical protein ACLB1M_27615 [Escherichia coli]